jgi:hypothetical protein
LEEGESVGIFGLATRVDGNVPFFAFEDFIVDDDANIDRETAKEPRFAYVSIEAGTNRF